MSSSNQGGQGTNRVIVVGAGMAGLAAARSLVSQGYHVTMLEGRERIGGRVHATADMIDLGAQWIHGHKNGPNNVNELYALSKEYGLKLLKTDYDNLQAYDRKGEISDGFERKVENMYEKMMRLVDKKTSKLSGNNHSLQEVMNSAMSEMKLTAEERNWMRNLNAMEIESDYSGSAAELNAVEFDEGGEVRGDDFVFPSGGFGQLPQCVLATLNKTPGLFRLVLNAPVSLVDTTVAAGVAVTAGTSVYTAAAVVVTVPLGVLKASLREGTPLALDVRYQLPAATLRFTPPLPKEVVKAVAVIGMGTLNKYVFEFPPGAQWPDRYDMFAYLSQPDEEMWWPTFLNWKKYTGRNVLVGFSAGTETYELSRMGDDEVQRKLLAQLRKMFGTSLPPPLKFFRTKWDCDPFSLGSYSYQAVGSDPSQRRVFREPLAGGRLYFAGEHTDKNHPQTVHGAWNSGVRAAAYAAAFLGGKGDLRRQNKKGKGKPPYYETESSSDSD